MSGFVKRQNGCKSPVESERSTHLDQSEPNLLCSSSGLKFFQWSSFSEAHSMNFSSSFVRVFSVKTIPLQTILLNTFPLHLNDRGRRKLFKSPIFEHTGTPMECALNESVIHSGDSGRITVEIKQNFWILSTRKISILEIYLKSSPSVGCGAPLSSFLTIYLVNFTTIDVPTRRLAFLMEKFL